MVETYAPIFIIEIGGQKLPEDISQHVESFSYEDHEDKMDELKFIITKGDLSFVDRPQLQEGQEVRVRWGYVGNLSDVRTCTIKEISYTFGEDGVARMEVTAFDKRHKLTGRTARTCWANKKVEDVVKDIARKHKLTPIVQVPDDITREFISEGGKNDMIFLKELAQDTGCSMWVVNDELHFEPNRLNEPVLKFRWREDRDGYLQSFKITSKAEQGKGTRRGTELAGIDPLTKKPIKETTTAKGTGKGQVNVHSLGDKPVSEKGNVGGGTLPENSVGNDTPLQQNADETGRVVPTPVPTAAQARREGQGKVQSASMGSIEANAVTIGLPYLKAKDTVTIENIGKKFSGNWRIKSVRHTLTEEKYMCKLTLRKSDYESGGSRKPGELPKTPQNNTDTATPAGEGKKTNRYSLGTGEPVS